MLALFNLPDNVRTDDAVVQADASKELPEACQLHRSRGDFPKERLKVLSSVLYPYVLNVLSRNARPKGSL